MDYKKIKTYPVKVRASKVRFRNFAKLPKKKGKFNQFLNSFPAILAARSFKALVNDIVRAKRKKKPVIFMMGAHVIKCGLSPLVIDLMNRGVIDCVVLNGACLIHDFEIAFCGQTSEDVLKSLKDGSFGMARETADFINNAIVRGVNDGLGAAESVGRMIELRGLPFRKQSILYQAYKKHIPATVHIAIGTDIIHQHPTCSGSHTGEATLTDFRKLIKVVSRIGNGGVVVGFGSSVILPEVFLKALNVARNLGFKVKNFTTAYFDMIQHYRPRMNIIYRPTQDGGCGYYIIGHHEIMLPLLAWSVVENL